MPGSGSAPAFLLSLMAPTSRDCRDLSLEFYFINSSMNMVQVRFPARFLSVKPQLCTGFQWLHLTLLQGCLGIEPGLHRSTVSSQKCSWIYKSSAFKYPHLQDCSWKNEMKSLKNKKMQLTGIIPPFSFIPLQFPSVPREDAFSYRKDTTHN